MSPRLLTILVIFPIWLALVLIFRKHRQWLLYYLVAAFGLTIQLVLLVEYLGYDQILVNVASFHVDLLTKYFFHIPIELLTNGRFQITMSDGSSSILKLGIECSAILESSIVLSLIIFYPLFNTGQKILRVLFGLIVTYVINILRLMIIVLMAYRFGSDYIFIAHAGVARIFFFICELILYWYLMTKPSVKVVGQSIEEGIPIDRVASVGHTFKLRYALTQTTVITTFVILVGTSFVSSNEWREALNSTAHQERPIVYQDETAIETLASNDEGRVLGAEDNQLNLQNEQVLGDFFFENMSSNEERTYKYQVLESGKFNIRLVQGDQRVKIEIYKNGQLENTADVEMPEEDLILDQNVFDQLVSADPDDILEIKFENTGEENANYVAEIISGETNDSQVSSTSTEASVTPDQNQVSTTVPATASAQTKTSTVIARPTVAGLATSSLNQEITLNLAGGEKSLQSFNIQQEEQLNVQVLQGQEDLAARLTLNGQSVELVTLPPWQFDKQTSIFKPLTVKPGDVLELKFQNLGDQPSGYLIKIFGDGTENAPTSPPEPVIPPSTPQPQPTSPPLVQVPAPAPERTSALSQVQKYLAGLVSGLTEEIPTDILVIKETVAVLARQFESFGHLYLQLANLCQENVKISEKALKLLIARQEPPIVYQDETAMETQAPPEDSQVSSTSTEASVTPDQNQVSTTPSATASAETKTSTLASGKVLGKSTGEDQYSDLQNENLKLQRLQIISSIILSTILVIALLILIATIIYFLKREAKRNEQ